MRWGTPNSRHRKLEASVGGRRGSAPCAVGRWGRRRPPWPVPAAGWAVAALAAVASTGLGSLPPTASGIAAGATRDGRAPSTGRATGSVRWLCRPGMADDPCTTSLTATAVSPAGTKAVQAARPARHPAIDCFYVYPTVSTEPRVNATRTVQSAERNVAIAQAARFSQACRVYAPLYRQLTLYALAHPTKVTPADARRAYGDVAAAWKAYLAHDNHGRGVVLIGHSQGATILINLIKREVDDEPSVRRRLVSAIVLGGNVAVPIGKGVGGSFRHVPACRATTQLHCVVAYSSFEQTPPANTFFGVPGQGVSKLAGGTSGHDLQVLCTNPAALSGGSGALSPYFPTADVPGAGVSTPWVTYPDMCRSHCEYRRGISWLQVDDVAPAGDTNPAVRQTDGPQWGLHVVDVNIALGNLVSLVRAEAAAYRRGG